MDPSCALQILKTETPRAPQPQNGPMEPGSMLVTEESRFPQMPNAARAKSGYLAWEILKNEMDKKRVFRVS